MSQMVNSPFNDSSTNSMTQVHEISNSLVDVTDRVESLEMSSTALESLCNYLKGELDFLLEENKSVNIKDLVEDLKEESKSCESKIDEVFDQMKEDRSKTSVLNPVFQYYVGMREAYRIITEKIEKKLKEED